MNDQRVCLLMLCLLGFAAVCGAKEKVYDPVADYGPRLDQVSFKERYLYNKTVGKDWYQSTLEQRHDFLMQYHEEMIEQQQEKKEYLKRQAEKKKLQDQKYLAKVRLEQQMKREDDLAQREADNDAKIQAADLARKNEELNRQIDNLHKQEKFNN